SAPTKTARYRPTYATLPSERPKLRPSFEIDEAMVERALCAYTEDESVWQGVTIAEIFQYLTRPDGRVRWTNPAPRDQSGSIKAWIDGGLFVLSDEGLMFTVSVYASSRAGYVMVVPIDCEASIVTTDGVDVYDGLRCLRGQLLYRAHDELLSGSTHMSVGASMNVLRESAWWPGMLSDLRHHISQCPVCSTSTRRLRKQVPSRPLPPRGRFQELQIDHKELPPQLKARLEGAHETGAILSMVDRMTGELALEYVKNKGAVVTAHTVIRRWFCKRGICTRFSSDNGSSFVSDLGKVLSSVLGYQLKFSCVRHPQGSANVERANSAASLALNFISESGDCEDVGDLEMHLASAEFAYNHNSGVFRRLFGEDVPTPLTTHQSEPAGDIDPVELDGRAESFRRSAWFQPETK
ncbi:hypothetical protein FOL46_002308, partial [Perkinsus olseni]